MKVGIIGCGAISNVHVMVLNDLGIEIAAICDIDSNRADRLKEKFGLKSAIYNDFHDLINSGIDVVHICTPHYLHTEMTIYALKKNINVLCEKPLCISLEEVDLIREALNHTDAKLGVCFQNRYLSSNIAAKKFLSRQKINSIIATVLWSRDADYYMSSHWRGKKITEGGGVLINQAIHTLDLMIWFTEMPQYIGSAF